MTYGPGYGGQPQPQGPTPQGYGAQGYGQQQPGYAMASPTPAATPAPGKGIPFYLTLAVAFIGVVNFFLGFTPFWSGGGESQNFFKTLGVVGLVPLLGAAVVAGFGLLPEQPKSEVVAAALSVTGCLTLLFLLVFKPEGQGTGMGMILVLILSFIQAGIAVVNLLYAAGILKPPQPQPQYGYYGQGYGAPGYGQPQQPAYGAQPQSQPPSQPAYQPPPQPSQPPQPQNPWG